MRMQISVKKSQLLNAYKGTLGDNYTADERAMYFQYASEDVGGWLGDFVLALVGVSSTGAVLHEVKEQGLLLKIDYEFTYNY